MDEQEDQWTRGRRLPRRPGARRRPRPRGGARRPPARRACRRSRCRRCRAGCSSCWPRIAGARRVLEVGTLGGYSTICLARALPADGELVTLELDPHHAEVARANLARAGLGGIVEIRVGRALDIAAPSSRREGHAPFDLVFIDADKADNPDYFELGREARPSRHGHRPRQRHPPRRGRRPAEDTTPTSPARARRWSCMGEDPRVTATVIQTVGSKGYDGFALAVVGGPAGA